MTSIGAEELEGGAMVDRRTGFLSLFAAAALVLAACGSTQVPPPASSAGAPSVSPTSTVPPTTASDLPDGTYRTDVTEQALQRRGVSDRTDAGIWTLIVKRGTYELQCRADSNPGYMCGDDGRSGNTTVESGWVRGPGPVVWFVHDPVRTAELCGTINGQPKCPMGGYHLSWAVTDAGLTFGDWVGLGDEKYSLGTLNNYTLQPWTRIA